MQPRPETSGSLRFATQSPGTASSILGGGVAQTGPATEDGRSLGGGAGITIRGSHIEILWDGEVVIASDDATFARGAIGVWTKADSIVRFDALVLEVL